MKGRGLENLESDRKRQTNRPQCFPSPNEFKYFFYRGGASSFSDQIPTKGDLKK